MSSLQQRTLSPERKIMLALKYDIIQTVENGMKPTDASRKFELPASTVFTISKTKEQTKQEKLKPGVCSPGANQF
jgi:Mor family transcriptional regulator